MFRERIISIRLYNKIEVTTVQENERKKVFVEIISMILNKIFRF